MDAKAYDLLLRGISFFGKQNIQDTVYARQMFNRALEIDPEGNYFAIKFNSRSWFTR